jgi:hypothetical protein
MAYCSARRHSLLGFTPGATKACPLHIAFFYDGTRYAIHMNPFVKHVNGPFPTTNYANATCIYPTSGNGACSQWKLTPSGTYIASDNTVKYRNAGKLVQADDNGNIVANYGDFSLSFQILIAKS